MYFFTLFAVYACKAYCVYISYYLLFMKIKRPLVERLGVPEGILDIAEEIYPKILWSMVTTPTLAINRIRNQNIQMISKKSIKQFYYQY